MPDSQGEKTKLKESSKMNGAETLNQPPKTNKGIDTHSSSASKKTRKRPSPFRIKGGCVVALRINPEGNHLSRLSADGQVIPVFPDDSLIPVWTSPIPYRDEGLALVGKRVRCFLPKHLVHGKKRRVLEGEVTEIYDFLTRPDDKPWKVDLLVDKSMLSEFPFLVRTDEDASQLPSEKARRNARLEEVIRGANKCTVRVRLSKPGSEHGKNSLKWVIQKIVPKKLLQSTVSNGANGAKGKTETGKRKADESDAMDNSGRGSTNGNVVDSVEGEITKKRRKVDQNAVKYVGDRDDSPDQQIANWRWMVGRYHDTLLSTEDVRWRATEAHLFSNGFVAEVTKVESMPKGSSSLASVTVRRMILPEQTAHFLSVDFERCDIFDDTDNLQNEFRVPIEELVVLSRKIHRSEPSKATLCSSCEDDVGANVPEFACRWAYSSQLHLFSYVRPNDEAPQEKSRQSSPMCHRCRRSVPNTETSVECCSGSCSLAEDGNTTFFCNDCIRRLSVICSCSLDHSPESPPCYMEFCDCLSCRVRYSNEMSISPSVNSGKRLKDVSPGNVFRSAIQFVSGQEPVGFGLPESMLTWSGIPAPSSKPVTRVKPIGQKSSQKGVNGKRKEGKSPSKMDNESVDRGAEPRATTVDDDSTKFKPTCARLLAYDTVQSNQRASLQMARDEKPERPRNLRDYRAAIAAEIDCVDKTNQRAERAKQRRLLKGIAAFSNLDMDTLASREPQLRFDRSAIHAWGVFADKDISSGDMIVEYRGEIIENAMAEKRERLYEAAKIGSDYMFRIDGRFVCDATKVGNVARFINASCDPNCYTKIINVDGQKRIVIYAKRDIAAGEELCYDYKFPLEYNPEKRIPCRCGASNCRGFMNWDKKYVVAGSAEAQTPRVRKAEGDKSVVMSTPLALVPEDNTTMDAATSREINKQQC